jgi:excisionase family DNA binding protein
MNPTRPEAVSKPNPKRTLTVQEAAEYLSVSKSYLNKLRSTGAAKLPFHKLGARVCYSIADLDAFLEQHRRLSTSDRGASVVTPQERSRRSA